MPVICMFVCIRFEAEVAQCKAKLVPSCICENASNVYLCHFVVGLVHTRHAIKCLIVQLYTCSIEPSIERDEFRAFLCEPFHRKFLMLMIRL